MTNTLDMIKKSLYIRSKELMQISIFALSGFVMGHIVLIAIMNIDDSPDLTSFEFGTVIAIIWAIFSIASIGAINYSKHLNYAVSMGKRRFDVITAHIFVALAKSLIVTSLIYIFHGIERLVCSTTYSEYPTEFNFDMIFTLPNYFAFLCIFVAIEVFFGAMQAKMGMKVFWIIWLIIMMGNAFIPSFIEKASGDGSDGITARIGLFFIDLFDNISFNSILPICVIISILLIISTYAILRKHRVAM